VLPKRARRTKSLDTLLPALHLRGISAGDFQEVFAALLSKDVPNLSPAVIARLKSEWEPQRIMVSLRSSSRAVRIRQAIEAAGAMLLYLPAYSPDFNPIEMAFSKFKVLLRAAAARTINDLREAIRLAIGAFKPSECQNYFVAAGYDAT